MTKEVILPVLVGSYYYNDFQKLVVACDTAMDDSWYNGKESLCSNESIQLLNCHDYDKARKIMLISGLPEEYLSYLGLKALEIYQRPAEEFVKHHRFEQR
jgi:His-Xaa-Ser system protein (TIGR03982 family)